MVTETFGSEDKPLPCIKIPLEKLTSIQTFPHKSNTVYIQRACFRKYHAWQTHFVQSDGVYIYRPKL